MFGLVWNLLEPKLFVLRLIIAIYAIIYLKTQITLVLEGFRTNPQKCELFEFDFFSTKKNFFLWKFKKFTLFLKFELSTKFAGCVSPSRVWFGGTF